MILMWRVSYIPSFFQILQHCSCSTNLCNRNWVEAGSTDHPVDTKEVPSDPIKVLPYYLCSHTMIFDNPFCSVLNVTHQKKGSVLMGILVIVRSVNLGMGAWLLWVENIWYFTCVLTWYVAETKVGKDDVLIRDCSEEYGNAEFDCNTINGEDAVWISLWSKISGMMSHFFRP